MQLLSIILCFTIHTRITSATSTNSSNTSSTEPCKLRNEWRNDLTAFWFDPTQDCLGLSKILETVNRDRKFNFCAADPDVVVPYIRSSMSGLAKDKRPHLCEVRQWYYATYGGKLKKPFCQNATQIYRRVQKKQSPNMADTQPYMTVVHGARSLCARKLKLDLKSIGDADLAGPGVLVSQIMEMIILLFFNLAAHCPPKFSTVLSLLRTTPHFYGIAALLSCSIATAALAAFLQRRSETKLLYSNFGYSDFYVNLRLVLALGLSIIPVVVLVLMPPKVPNHGNTGDLKLWDKNGKNNTKTYLAGISAILLYSVYIAIMWAIWALGICGQRNPTQVVFGGVLDVLVSSFIYQHASTYVLLVCVFMTALPLAGLAALVIIRIWYRTDKKRRYESLSILRDTFRNIFGLFGIVQLIMAAYIRSQSVHQANGATSETQWGFGQFLVVFTWLPVLWNIVSAHFNRRSSQPTSGHNTGSNTVQNP